MTRLERVQNLLNNHCEFESRQEKEVSNEKHKEIIKDWNTFYRRNWDIYAEYELGLPLKWVQQIVLYLMGISDVFFLFCSRGWAKSWLSGLGAVIACMVYPDSEIVLSATTIKTAKKFVQKKIEGELCGKMSPKLNYLYKKGLIKFSYDQEEIRVSFVFNRSWIIVLPETNSSLGERATGLIFEEARQSKMNILDRVFIPMRHARVPRFKNNPLYANDTDLIEKAKIIYLTSVSFRFEPIWRRWVQTVENTFNDNDKSKGVYNIMIGDVYTSLIHGFMDVADYNIAKDSSSELEFRMEYLNESPTEGDGNFYDYKMFRENSILSNAFIPPTYDEWLYKYKRGTIDYFRKKREDEIRCIYVDFAFNDSVKAENDLTVMGCMSGYPDENYEKMLRNVEYMESFSGGDKDASLLRIRELFFLYEADYLVVDVRNGGVDRVMELTIPYEHEELGLHMNGFGFSTDESLTNYFYSKEKLDKLRQRTVDPNAMEVTIVVAGTDERNDSFHRQMRDALLGGTIRFIKDSATIKREWEEEDIMATLTLEDMPRRLYPYLQIELMIKEAVQLEKKLIKGGFTKLSEVGGNTKDKIVCTEYGNYLFYLLEQKMIKNKQNDGNDIDWEALESIYC